MFRQFINIAKLLKIDLFGGSCVLEGKIARSEIGPIPFLPNSLSRHEHDAERNYSLDRRRDVSPTKGGYCQRNAVSYRLTTQV
jgi:hypothetical protein